MPAAVTPAAPGQGPLRQMADRIARNREVLGLHYRSDSVAGKTLADRAFTTVMGGLPVPPNPNPIQTLVDVLKVARQEWEPRV